MYIFYTSQDLEPANSQFAPSKKFPYKGQTLDKLEHI